jgi:hypothetical protein
MECVFRYYELVRKQMTAAYVLLVKMESLFFKPKSARRRKYGEHFMVQTPNEGGVLRIPFDL